MNNNELRFSPATVLAWVSITLIVTGFILSGLSLIDGGLTDQNTALMLGMGEIIGGAFILIIGTNLKIALNFSTNSKEL